MGVSWLSSILNTWQACTATSRLQQVPLSYLYQASMPGGAASAPPCVLTAVVEMLRVSCRLFFVGVPLLLQPAFTLIRW